ncbi:hypothetical protein [Kineococcus sp. SYSU DK004]|uniref:hypothetical protein n=1 Tax=Kineococcus sp. SYSU DK004 TaxID=3383125 RepID=UPI003D7D86BE
MTGRRGHLREQRDAAPTVPELLATDALLDRLGSHTATEEDLRDVLARVLDGYALHADPRTAGVRPLQLPEELPAPGAEPPGEVRAGHLRVLTARRRTLRRAARGGAAVAAALALLGGTAAAAATHRAPATVEESLATERQVPSWLPTQVYEVFGPSRDQLVQQEVARASAAASAGETDVAVQRVRDLVRLLESGGADPALVAEASSAFLEISRGAAVAVGAGAADDPAAVPGAPAATKLPELVRASRTAAPVLAPVLLYPPSTVAPTRPPATDGPTTAPTRPPATTPAQPSPSAPPQTQAPAPTPTQTSPQAPSPTRPPTQAPSPVVPPVTPSTPPVTPTTPPPVTTPPTSTPPTSTPPTSVPPTSSPGEEPTGTPGDTAAPGPTEVPGGTPTAPVTSPGGQQGEGPVVTPSTALAVPSPSPSPQPSSPTGTAVPTGTTTSSPTDPQVPSADGAAPAAP